MPHAEVLNPHRVPVRLDHGHHPVHYESANQYVLSSRVQQPSRAETYGLDEEEEDLNIFSESVSLDSKSITLPGTRARHHKTQQPIPRRVRYVPQPSNVTIFNERVDWNSEARVDTWNDSSVGRIQRAPRTKIFSEPLAWSLRHPGDVYDDDPVEHTRRSLPKSQRIVEKPVWTGRDQLNLQNQGNAKRRAGRAKPVLPNQKLLWPTTPNMAEEHSDYVEWRRRAKFPPIQERRPSREPQTRINLRNDDYIEHMRQRRSHPSIFHRTPRWRVPASRIDNQHDEFVEKLRTHKQATIFDEKLRWRSEPKVNTYNQQYSAKVQRAPAIFNEKLRWHAKTRIDTGLMPLSDDEESTDGRLTARSTNS